MASLNFEQRGVSLVDKSEDSLVENIVGFTSSLIRSVESFHSSSLPTVEGIPGLLETTEVTSPEKDKTGEKGDFGRLEIMLDTNRISGKSRWKRLARERLMGMIQD